MKAYNYNGVLYKSRDLAILCNGTNDVQEVVVRKRRDDGREIKVVQGEVVFTLYPDKEELLLEVVADDLYMTWFETIEFKFDYSNLNYESEYDFMSKFENVFKGANFTLTDLSESLQEQIYNECIEREWEYQEVHGMKKEDYEEYSPED